MTGTTCPGCGRPRLLDLCSGAGGAAMGYHRAGFCVTGVDAMPQPHYPFRFVQADALQYAARHARRFAASHGSPPCQPHSAMSACRPGLAGQYVDLIAALRSVLDGAGVPYVLENVPGSPLRPDAVLCGQMFGLELYRHRLFEATFPLQGPPHPDHVLPASRAGHWQPGTIMSVAGHVAPVAKARQIMGIGWTTREELAEAVPPAYTEHVGRQLLRHLQESGRVAA